MSRGGGAVSRFEAERGATAVRDAIEALRPGACAALRENPLAEVGGWNEVEVRVISEHDTKGGCSVAGAYLQREKPPVLVVTRAQSTGRQAFTVLHELAHHLQRTTTLLAQALLDAKERAAGLEEAICDAFAASVLLPDAELQGVLASSSPTVSDIAELRRSSAASRAAVCVRAAQRLTSPGQVILLDHDGAVQFRSAHGLPPVPLGVELSGIEVVRQALDAGNGTRKGRTRLLYRDGHQGEELFAQAGDLEGYLVIVVMTDRPPWEESFVLPSRETSPVSRQWVCEHAECGVEFESFDPVCTKCKAPKCLECGRCGCAPVVAERTCPGCFTVYPERFFDSGSTLCQNCA